MTQLCEPVDSGRRRRPPGRSAVTRPPRPLLHRVTPPRDTDGLVTVEDAALQWLTSPERLPRGPAGLSGMTWVLLH